MSTADKEKLYLEAKEKYYKGDEIMSDYEFDMLEEELKRLGSSVVKIVGTKTIDKSEKVQHTFPMLSLDKTNVYDEDINNAVEPLADISKFMHRLKLQDGEEYESTLKYDGSAIELVYENGQLVKCSTRGDGEYGQDQTEKIKNIVPKRLPEKFSHSNYEVRGEVVIVKKAFDKKWSVEALGKEKGFKNARNFVAGIIAREEFDPKIWEDFVYVAYFVRRYDDKNNWNFTLHSLTTLTEMGFNYKYPLFSKKFKNIQEFKEVYRTSRKYREEESPFLLDGMVITFPEKYRIQLGENEHDYEWAYAIKFPPVAVITEIVDIDWKTGTSGEVIPTAIMKPVELDGSTVKRAALHNAGHVENTKTWPGAKVEIYKAGDIIPQIKRVVVQSSIVGNIPNNCPTCKSILLKEDIHLWCMNDECYAQLISKIEAGKNAFKIENVGKSAIEKLYVAGIKRFQDYFDKSKFNRETLLKSGHFVKGRSFDIIVEAVESIKSVELKDVISSLKLQDTGKSVSEAIARKMAGLDVDFSGLNKEAVRKILSINTIERNKLEEFLTILKNNGINVRMPSDKIDNSLPTYVMTGTPPAIKGLKHKADYSKVFASKGFKEVGKVDETISYLITDDMLSDSGKMTKAKSLIKKGSKIEIITYEDFYKKHVGVVPNQQKSVF